MKSELLSCDRKTNDKIRAIIARLREDVPSCKFDALALSMDLTVCHNLGHVDLDTLLEFSFGDFCHDLDGIHNNLDRETGELANCFLPRCHNREQVESA